MKNKFTDLTLIEGTAQAENSSDKGELKDVKMLRDYGSRCTEAKKHGLLKGTKILRCYDSKMFRVRDKKAAMQLRSQAAKREMSRHCEGGNGLPPEAIRLNNNIFGKITPHPLFKKNFLPLTRIAKFTSFTKQFRPLPQGAREKLTNVVKDVYVRSIPQGEREYASCAKRTEKNLSPLTTHFSREGKRYAFTLAETLITLGIIGVVAALTLPSVIHKYRAMVLKTQFKKAYSSVAQAVQRANAESGLELGSYCIQYDGTKGYYNKSECLLLVLNYFNRNGMCNYDTNILNYKKNTNAHVDIGASVYTLGFYQINDGICLNFNTNAFQFGLAIDINGAKKGPNALGHDVFVFWVNRSNSSLIPVKTTKIYTENELAQMREKNNIPDDGSTYSTYTTISSHSTYEQAGYPCSRTDSRHGNGLGCSWYALNDICPDDAAKGYWECLPR